MAGYDDNYVLDADGKRVLIGLTLDETIEFERLTRQFSIARPTKMITVFATKGAGSCFTTSMTPLCDTTYQPRTLGR